MLLLPEAARHFGGLFLPDPHAPGGFTTHYDTAAAAELSDSSGDTGMLVPEPLELRHAGFSEKLHPAGDGNCALKRQGLTCSAFS